MLQHLDEHELEAVLAHELSHAARRDSLVVWLATVLRDSFFYLPASQSAYRQLQDDKELACDELAVGVTRRPMALASTLVKVWQKTAVPTPAMAQSLHGEAGLLQNRIARLLAPAPPSNLQRQQSSPLVIGLSALAVALVVEALITMTILAPMACGPFSPLGFVH